MLELTLQQIRQIELDLLIEFDKICNEKGYRYSLGGGTLLGAIRHNGFIPWDDDIDVMMPRPDYEKFINYSLNNNIPFTLITHTTMEGYNGLFAKLSDSTTVLQDNLIKDDYDLGVNIDIFPIDGLGNSEIEARKILKKTELQREILNAISWKRYFRSKTHGLIFEPIRLALYYTSRFINPKKILKSVDEKNLKYSFDSSSYAGCICGSYRTKEIMKKEVFEKYIDVKFENNIFKAVSDYDTYLTKLFGNYMVLPPEKERVTHHSFQAFYKD